MTRVPSSAIVAASILFALRSGTGMIGDIEEAIRGRADAVTRTVPVEGGSLLRASAFAAALEGFPPATSRCCGWRRASSTRR